MRTGNRADSYRCRLKKAACCVSLAGAFVLWTGPPQLACRADTVRIANRPIVVNEKNLAIAAALSKISRTASRTIRAIALVDNSFSRARLARFGWRVVVRTGDVVTLHGDAAIAPYLGALDGVRMIKRPSRIYPLMDTVRKYCGIDQVHGTQSGGIGRFFTGAGVLFGIIDTDFDVHHPAFVDSTGRTRFIAVWDQNDTGGTVPNRFGYGCIKHRDGLEVDSLFGMCNRHHGTTMLSYGAGSERTNSFYGVAPDVLIAGVCMGELDDGIIDGLHWLFSLADSLNLPCVINMSLGYHDGPHDGTSLVDRTIDTLSGPGRIVVGSAGNDGHTKAHVTFSVGPDDTAGAWAYGAGQIDTTGVQSGEFGIELWGEVSQSFYAAVLVLDTASGRLFEGMPVLTTDTTIEYEPDTLALGDSMGKSDTVILKLLTERASALNSKPHIQVTMHANTVDLIVGVRVSSRSAATIQAWNMTKQAFMSRDTPGFLEGDTVMSVNELGGTGRSTITVGAYTSKLKYTLYDGRVKDWGGEDLPWHFLCGYSSHGPTADGRIKPDITAPGSDLIGAMPRDASGGSIVIWPDTQSTVGRYWASGGTSASAPVVTGIVALMLQADSSLTPERARQCIQESALTDSTTGPIPTPSIFWGAGRVSGLGAIAKLLGIGVRPHIIAAKKRTDYSLLPIAHGRFQLIGRTITGTSIEILSLNGRPIARIKPDRFGVIALPPLAAGVWVIQATRSGNRLCATRITNFVAHQ